MIKKDLKPVVWKSRQKGSNPDEMVTFFQKKWYLRSILTSSCLWSFTNYDIVH